MCSCIYDPTKGVSLGHPIDLVGISLDYSIKQRLNSCGLVDDFIGTMHARIQKELPEGVQLCITVFFYQGREKKRIQIVLKVGHHQPASETPFKWLFAGRPMTAQHLLAR